MKSVRFYSALAVAAFVGAYLRLDQFVSQVLIDDEWHAVHILLGSSPKEIFLNFGSSDFSIPLALLYWLEADLFGLSELGMRWPMMAAGILALVILPLYCRRYFDDKTAIIFSLLLAFSPLLLIYSRTARPYSLTLLLSLVSLAAFYSYANGQRPNWRSGLLYVLCAVLSCWLHIITGPLVIAPFVAVGLTALYSRDWNKIRRLLVLAIPTAIGLLVFLLPPLMSNPAALSWKMGMHRPDVDTLYGVLYSWLGTSSLLVVVVALLLAVLGSKRLFQSLPILPALLAGLGLTLAAILFTQPLWVNHALTFGRYLLPMVPLLLLAVALGMVRVAGICASTFGRFGNGISVAGVVLAFSFALYHSPVARLNAYPNSNSLHSVYQFDFRDSANEMADYQRDHIPISSFWSRLSSFSPGSLKIAASPFHFASYDWDAVRWERRSRQYVLPGLLNDFCVTGRKGEVPHSDRFDFRNAAYVGDVADVAKRGFDLVVYQKPPKTAADGRPGSSGSEFASCEAAFRQRYPSPVFEDELLIVFPVTEEVRNQLRAGEFDRVIGKLSH